MLFFGVKNVLGETNWCKNLENNAQFEFLWCAYVAKEDIFYFQETNERINYFKVPK